MTAAKGKQTLPPKETHAKPQIPKEIISGEGADERNPTLCGRTTILEAPQTRTVSALLITVCPIPSLPWVFVEYLLSEQMNE